MISTAVESTGVPSQGRPSHWRERVSPWIWIAPALLFLIIFLLYPLINTVVLSFKNSDSSSFVGFTNYSRIFTSSGFIEVLENNLLWLVLGTAATVAFGLVIAVLVDRVRIESLAKSTIFIPMAISFVGASVIWRFVYAYSAPGQAQIGLLNAFLGLFGAQPQTWLINSPLNNFALITVYIWMWTGFCMVILSAALKGVPTEILEAARMDGASEITIFFRVIVPLISPTIAVVATTMVINLLKIFDIIYVMTGGDFHTNVIAMAFYQQYFNFNNFGIACALAVILMVVIIPVMLFNLRRFRAQEAQR